MHRAAKPCGVVAAILLIGGLVALAEVEAHTGATGVVKERMDLMKALGDDMKRLAAIMKAEAAYDPALVAGLARRIEQGSGDHMLELFPEGSTDHPSEAREEIWLRWVEFEAKADALASQASALSVAGDFDEARMAFAKVAESCKACHRDFKED